MKRAVDINNKGQIAGYGCIHGKSNVHAFLMKPIPLEGDLNNDGIVDFYDFAKFANHWLEDNHE